MTDLDMAEQHPRMSGKVRLSWQLVGIASLLIGAYLMDGWPATLFAFGLWSIITTITDALDDKLVTLLGRDR